MPPTLITDYRFPWANSFLRKTGKPYAYAADDFDDRRTTRILQ